MAENAPPNSIVMVNEPVPAYVHVQRKTIGYPKADRDFVSYLNNQGIDYIVVAPELQSPRSTELGENVSTYILPILNSQADKFIMVFQNNEHNVSVYEYLDGDE